jgi:hypothetical protein
MQLYANPWIKQGLALIPTVEPKQQLEPKRQLDIQPSHDNAPQDHEPPETMTQSMPLLEVRWTQAYLDRRVQGHFGGARYAIAVIQALDRYRRNEGNNRQSDLHHVRGIVDACEQFLRLERDNRNGIPDRKERIEVVSELLEAAKRAR